MTELVKKVNDFITHDLWRIDITSLDRFKALLIRLTRLIFSIVRESSERELTLRAMSLVYTTLLSIVPLLAFSFSILKAFGVVDSQLEPILSKFLMPLGAKGVEITHQIMEFVQNMKVGVLGIIGLLVLIYTVISLINKMEDSLNHIWRVKEGRSIARRFSDYITMILIGPVLIFAVFGLTANLVGNTLIQKIASIDPIGAFIAFFVGKILSFIVVLAIFTFIYIVIPNTKVNVKSALIGGIVAGIGWQAVGWVFAKFVVTSTKYAAIYSSFAVLILFMIWLYASWLILLIGSEVSFCYQNLKFLSLNKQQIHLGNRLKEKLTVIIMYLISYNFHHDKGRLTLDSLINRLRLPIESIQDALFNLKKKNLIIEIDDNSGEFLPAKDIDTMRLNEILDSVREKEEEIELGDRESLFQPEVDTVFSRIDSAIENTLGELTIKELVISGDEDSKEASTQFASPPSKT